MALTTMTISGAERGDECYEIEHPVTGELICWNATRIKRDAEAGRFELGERPVTGIAWEAGNLDMARVELFRTRPDILSIPAIEVFLRLRLAIDGKEVLYGLPIDGNHRAAAANLNGETVIKCWGVPPELEGEYRVDFEVKP